MEQEFNYREKVKDYLPEFIEELTKQLDEDEKRWGDTWKKRPREGQEERMFQSLMDYKDKYENGKQPYPTMRAIGGFLINWIREFEQVVNNSSKNKE